MFAPILMPPATPTWHVVTEKRAENTMPKEPFGAYLRKRRAERNLTQSDIEKSGGPSQGYLSDLEKSAETDTPKTPHRKMIPRIAKGLGVPVAEVEEAAGLVRGASLPPTPPPPIEFPEKAGMRPVRLSTGDVIYLSPHDSDPQKTITALDAWFQGWRAGNVSN